MRKLRRLPWRIPKSHHAQANAAPAETSPRVAINVDLQTQREIEREIAREAALNAQPVAFAGGRYVYDEKSAPPRARPARTPEIRRKARHHAILPLPVAG